MFYHIMEEEVDLGVPYQGKTLETEGFIHGSYGEQLGSTIERHYPNRPNLWALVIRSRKLDSLRVERSSGETGFFPHSYQSIPPEAIAAQIPIKQSGKWVFTPHEEDFIISDYQEKDENDTVALWKICGLTRPWNDPHRDIQRHRENQDRGIFIARIKGEVIASIMTGYDGHRGWVYYLAVHPDFQRRGYGRRMLGAAESFLKDLGCPKMEWMIRKDNHQARQWYQGLGYEMEMVDTMGIRLIED